MNATSTKENTDSCDQIQTQDHYPGKSVCMWQGAEGAQKRSVFLIYEALSKINKKKI